MSSPSADRPILLVRLAFRIIGVTDDEAEAWADRKMAPVLDWYGRMEEAEWLERNPRKADLLSGLFIVSIGIMGWRTPSAFGGPR